MLTTGERPLTVQASDADSGVNSKLMYEIVEQSARNLFQVDALTGTITTTQVRTLLSSEFTRIEDWTAASTRKTQNNRKFTLLNTIAAFENALLKLVIFP